MSEAMRIPQSELGMLVENTESSYIIPSQKKEIERLRKALVRDYDAGNKFVTSEVFEQRVRDAMKLIEELSDMEPLESKGREQFAQNARISLENFIVEEVVAYGVNPEKLKEQILEMYEHVKKNNEVCINLNYKTLFDIISSGGNIKSFEDLSDEKRRRREGHDFFGRPTNYRERRTARDTDLGMDDTFVVGALGTANGYDEVIGPAPFYGHGTLRFKEGAVRDRTSFYEGDSMTNSNTASVVIPNWLLRKWNKRESRKLDKSGAELSKALMEVCTKNRGLTHVHLMYIETHITGEVSLEDVRKITYATGTQEQEKQELYDRLKSPIDEGDAISARWLLKRIVDPEQARDDAFIILNSELGLSEYNLSLDIIQLDGQIFAAEDPFQEGAQTAALRKDSLF